jgi:hypothetical protein
MTKRSRTFDRGRGYYLSLVMGLVLIASNAAAATFALSAPPPFGNQIVNTTSAPQNAVVTNTGKSVLVFTATTTGDFHTTGSSCNGSVPVGGACNVFITFRPTAAGARTGTLSSPTRPRPRTR